MTAAEVYFHLTETRGRPKRGKRLYPFGSLPAQQTGLPDHNEVAHEIAERLGEQEDPQRRQIENIVWALGQVQAWALMLDAQEIDAGEGMMTPDGSRRRTVGGIFFYLVYNKGVPEPGKELKRFFPAKKKKPAGQPVAPQTAPSVSVMPPFEWQDRIAIIQEAEVEKGSANVKLTVVGRPGKVVDRGTCVVTVMEATKVPSLPKGLPTPPAAPTKYTVYISSKHWKKVAEAIADPEDVLIVEGFPTLDSTSGTIAVFATNTTTKKLQMAQKGALKAKTEANSSGGVES